jgi:hypothetical protein
MPTANQIIAGLLDATANAVSVLDLTAIGEDSQAVASKLWRIAAYLRNRSAVHPSFTCPCCGAVTRNPDDIAARYCGLCHWWVGDATLGPEHFANECPNRVRKP